MAFPVQFAKLSSSIHRPAVQPYHPAHSSPAIQDSHYDLNHSALHRKSWSEYREDEKAVSSVNDPVCARRVRVRTIGAAVDSLPADEKDGELPLPTISPTSSRDDLSILGERRLTSLARHRSFWLSLYFVLNLTLTLYNKAILVSFPFPYTLTAIHSLCAAVGGRILLKYNVYRPRPLTAPDYIVLAAFSVLYSINIAVSNASLELVSIPLHQVIRGMTPLFTTVLAFYLLDAHTSLTKLAPLLPVVFGVGLATYGDYSATAWGFSLTLLGAVLAAFKTVTTHLLQTSPCSTPSASSSMPASRHRAPFLLHAHLLGITLALPHPPAIRLPHLRLHPLDLLTRMSPFAFAQCLVYAHLSGELSSLRSSTGAETVMYARLLLPTVLAVNGAVAFGLNVVSFEANRRAGAVAMGVASNVKQVLTILCAVSLFEISVSRTNATGILLTLVGGAWYAAVEGSEKRGCAAGAR